MASVESLKAQHKIWFFSFLIGNFLIVFLAVIANPYRLLPFSITITGLNDIKPKLYEYQRYVKIFDMAKQKPKTVLLGSSRILWGIDPKHSALQQRHYMPVYNGGILGPPMYEIRKYFDHALASQPHLKRVILGIDFYAFNQAFDGRSFLQESDFGKSEKQLLKMHSDLIYDVKSIFLTLKDSLFRNQCKSLREDGRLTPAPLEAREVYKDFFVFTSKKTEKKVTVPGVAVKQSPTPRMKNILYESFKLSKVDMDAYRYIVDTCKKRNIELYVFITPPYNRSGHGSELDAYHQFGIWKDYINFLRQLAFIHPYWNFISWNEVTTNQDNYIDGSHFIFSVGDMILKKMFHVPDSSIPENFGNYVTAENVDHFIKNFDLEYKRSLRNV